MSTKSERPDIMTLEYSAAALEDNLNRALETINALEVHNHEIRAAAREGFTEEENIAAPCTVEKIRLMRTQRDALEADKAALCPTHRERLKAAKTCPMCEWLEANTNRVLIETEQKLEVVQRDKAALIEALRSALAECDQLREQVYGKGTVVAEFFLRDGQIVAEKPKPDSAVELLARMEAGK